ncbi:MAG: mannonate dehydratase [Verrucomicrobia bacterium]|nr:mannonate dehydratase [Verrucomicrobiota bacterium]
MRLASVLTPLSEHNLTLAAQCGVEDITVRYPADLEDLPRLQRQIESHGLKLAIVEGYLPIEKLKLGRDRDGRELAAMKTLIRKMGKLGIRILCYNFMAGTDWVRTRLDLPERGGARVTGFDVHDAERAMSLSATASEIAEGRISAEELWANLERLLRELMPVAEECGVFLAMHPDDPPLPEFQGKARIMNSVANFERLVRLVPSAHNGICFCQGTFAAMGVDIPATIRRLGSHVRYVHFRDVRATGPGHFVETFHDNGPTDMVAAMAAYRDVGFTGPMRPDHVPQLIGEENGEPGYTMLGRLFAYGYMRGLMQASEKFDVVHPLP